MNDGQNLAILDKMLRLAELASRQHSDRRQVEFRVFISYITLLALAFYQLLKVSDFDVSELGAPMWAIVVAVIIIVVVLISLHFVYWRWQTTIHIASNNDVRRRDFYLKKAECIAYYLSWNTRFIPSNRVNVSINLGVEDSAEMTEYSLFKCREPDIFIKLTKGDPRCCDKNGGSRKTVGTPPRKLYKNRHVLFPLAVSTALMLFIVATLVFKCLGWL